MAPDGTRWLQVQGGPGRSKFDTCGHKVVQMKWSVPNSLEQFLAVPCRTKWSHVATGSPKWFQVAPTEVTHLSSALGGPNLSLKWHWVVQRGPKWYHIVLVGPKMVQLKGSQMAKSGPRWSRVAQGNLRLHRRKWPQVEQSGPVWSTVVSGCTGWSSCSGPKWFRVVSRGPKWPQWS